MVARGENQCNLFCGDFRVAIASEIPRSNGFIDFSPYMVILHLHDRLNRWVAIGWLSIPIGVLGQPSSNLSPLPEDLIPALLTCLDVGSCAIAADACARHRHRPGRGRANQRSGGHVAQLGNHAPVWQQYDNVKLLQGTSSSSSVGFFPSVSANQAALTGSPKAQVHIGKIGVRIAERNYADAYRQLIVSVRTQFMTLIGKKIGLRNADFALQQAEEALAAAKDKITAKTLPPGADIGAQMAMDDARLTRDRMIEDLENSVRIFALSIGKADFGTQNIPNEIPRPSYEPDTAAQLLQRFVQEQGEKTYAIANLRDEIKQAELSYRMAKVRLRPMIGFSAYFSQQPTVSVGSGPVQQYITQSRIWIS